MTNFAAVFLRLMALALPVAALGWWLRIYPRRGLVWLAVAPALATLALIFEPAATTAILALDARAGLRGLGRSLHAAAAEGIFPAARSGADCLAAKPHAVTLTLVNHSSRPRHVALRDGLPHELRPEPQQFLASWTAAAGPLLRYVLRPRRRGAFEIQRVFLLARSRLGLWQRLLDYPLATTIHVYPDLQQLNQYALLGPHEPAQPAGRAADAEDRPGPRIRTAPRLHGRRQPQADRLAGDRPAKQAHRSRFPGHPMPADRVPHRRRTVDDQRVGRA